MFQMRSAHLPVSVLKVAGTLLLAASLPAFAGTISVDTTGVSDPVFAGSTFLGWGGEFSAVESGVTLSPAYNSLAGGDTATGAFLTFCIELNEDIALNTTYSFTESNSLDYSGGTTSPLTIGAAYLYSQFVNGTLAGYTYPTLTALNAPPQENPPYTAAELSSQNLQNALWDLQGQTIGADNDNPTVIDSASSLSNPYIQLVAQIFSGGTYAASDPSKNSTALEEAALNGALVASNGAYGVHVLNVTNGGVIQNQLVVTVPDGGLTIALIGAGLLSMLALRNRFAPVSKSVA